VSGGVDLSRAKRVGIYGGSFDPVHSAHLYVARAAQSASQLDAIVFVPAARPPHKPERRLASNADRAAMLTIALAGEPSWSICELEFERDGPSYTIDTVRELPARLGLSRGVELFLLLGWDNLRGFERWREVRALVELVQPIVVSRDGDDAQLLEPARRELGPELFAKLERGLVRVPARPESSTDLRDRLARGEDPGAELPPGVLEYIRARGIYAADARGGSTQGDRTQGGGRRAYE
jgi:nicotinate-nucleotide adenylyltransferase